MVYLDNGATGFPKPPGVAAAADRCLRYYCGNPGRSGHGFSIRTGREVEQTRRLLAELLGVPDPSGVLFTANTTEALNLALHGLLQPGDHVITSSMEHNSVLRPLKALEGRGIHHTIIPCRPDGSLPLDRVERAIRPQTRMLAFTCASNVTGTLFPMAELGALAKKRGLLYLADGAQAAGSVPLHMTELGIDLLAVPGHKGLQGPQGTGALCVNWERLPKKFAFSRHRAAAESFPIVPLRQGGTGTASKSRLQPAEPPEAYESGTLNAPGIIGWGEGLRWLQNTGIRRIQTHEKNLVSFAQKELSRIPGVLLYGPEDPALRTGLLAFNLTDPVQPAENRHLEKGSRPTGNCSFETAPQPAKIRSCEEVAQQLWDRFGIALRAGYHCAGLAHKTLGTWDTGCLRAGFGPFNTVQDVQALVQAIHTLQRERP